MKIEFVRADVKGYDADSLTDAQIAGGVRLTDYDDEHIYIVDCGRPMKVKADIKTEVVDLDIDEVAFLGHYRLSLESRIIAYTLPSLRQR